MVILRVMRGQRQCQRRAEAQMMPGIGRAEPGARDMAVGIEDVQRDRVLPQAGDRGVERPLVIGR